MPLSQSPLMMASLVLQSLGWLPIALGVAVVAIGWTWWVYGPQVRSRGPWVRYGLPIIRTVALLALIIALLQPVVLRAKSPDSKAAVIVLVDRSLSMDVVDPARSPAQLIALADGLKLLPPAAAKAAPAVTSDDVDRLRADQDRIAKTAGEWDYAKLTARGVDAAAGRVDESIAQLKSDTDSIVHRAKDSGKPSPAVDRVAEVVNGLDRNRPNWLNQLQGRLDRVAQAVADSESREAEQVYKDSPALRATGDQLSTLSRHSLAMLAAKRISGDLPTDQPLLAYEFGATLSPATIARDEDASHAGATPQTVPPDDATTQKSTSDAIPPADANNSDLTGAIRAALQKAPPDGIAAVILLSDGRPVNPTGSLPGSEVPIFTVPMARSAPPKDVSVTRLTVPTRSFVGETITVRAELRSIGIHMPLPVRMVAAPAGTGQAANVAIPADATATPGDAKAVNNLSQEKFVSFPDDNPVTAEFSFKVDRPGPWSVAISMAAQPGEVSAMNNSASREISVLSDKIHVLAIGQSAGRDFQFFCDALTRSNWVSLEQAIAPGPDAAAVLDPAKLANVDAILLEDAAAGTLDAAGWAAIKSAVVDRGCGLIGLAGDIHDPMELLSQNDASVLLPIAAAQNAQWRTWSGEYPTLRIVPDQSAGDHAHLPEPLRLADDAEGSIRRWQELPAVYRLLEFSKLKPAFAPLLVDDQNHLPVVVAGRVGSGRVDWIGTNETWRWRMKVGQRDQDRFFLQLIRDVAGEPYTVESGGISLDADRLVAEPGQPIRVRAKQVDSAGKPVASEAMSLTVTSSDGSADRSQAMQPVGRGNGRFETTLNNLPPGTYRLSAAGHEQPQLTLQVAASSEAELANLSGDERYLRRLAEGSGGQLVAIDALGDLPSLIAARPQPKAVTAELKLWDSPYLFAFVVACLTFEWAVRKQSGLA